MKPRYDKQAVLSDLLRKIENAGWAGFEDPYGVVAQTQLIGKEIEGRTVSGRLKNTTRNNPSYQAALTDLDRLSWLDDRNEREKHDAKEIRAAESRRRSATALVAIFEKEFERRWGGWPVFVGRRVIDAICEGDAGFFKKCTKYLRKTSVQNRVPRGNKAAYKVAAIAFIIEAVRSDTRIAPRHLRAHLKEEGHIISAELAAEWLREFCPGPLRDMKPPGRMRAPTLSKTKSQSSSVETLQLLKADVARGARFFAEKRGHRTKTPLDDFRRLGAY